MDIFDQIDPVPRQALARPLYKDPPASGAIATFEGGEAPPEWPRTHVAPPIPYSATRHANGRWLPGTSGNPKGKPISFGELVRHYSDNGVELVAWAWGVLRGEVTHLQFHPKTGELVDFEAGPALKFEIVKWLKDQGFGKEVARLDVTSNGETISGPAEDCPDLSKLTTEEVRVYLQLRKKSLAAPRVIDVTP